ncbi:MAG: hypothetical protein JRJ87_23370 [Deltaproteobacteria bacterium]|nr:hypothetical protein [Deltaproteobacteria bacterium]
MKRRIITLFVVLSLGLASVALGDSIPERFRRGGLEFEHKNFGNAIKMLNELLYPAVLLTVEDDIVKAREMLGLCYFYTGAEAKAKDEFIALLYLRPLHRLDAFLVPPPAVAFYDKIWNEPEMRAKLEKIEKERAAMADKNKKPPRTLVKKIYLERSETHRSRFVAFLPFGLGQFQNDQTTKGILLAVGGGLSLTANIVCYSLLVSLANDNGKYAAGDMQLARGLRIGQYVSLGLFATAWIYGAIDANVYFEPVTTSPYKTTKEEQEILPGETPSLMPSLLPSGAGLSFQTRF